jgi:hypothetical protein
MKVSGANEVDYNGTFQIIVVNSTTFTYLVANSPSTPATGTILYVKAGLGWTKPFAAGTNSQTYRSADITSNQFYLQVIDNGATAGGGREAQVYGAEVMVADQAVNVGRFPTAVQMPSGVCWEKSSTADSSTRGWYLAGDDKTFYFWHTSSTNISNSGMNNARTFGFGHFIPYKSDDAFNTFIVGDNAFPGAVALSNLNSFGLSMSYGYNGVLITGSLYAPRSYTQIGSAVNLNTFGTGYSTSAPTIGAVGGPSSGLIGYPNIPDAGVYVVPFTAWETGINARGRFPGLYAPTFSGITWSQGDRFVINNPSPMSCVLQYTSSQVTTNSTYWGTFLVDIFGPWV